MSRTILLPNKLAGVLHNLTKYKEEHNGVLIYRPDSKYHPDSYYCPVSYAGITGKGTPGHVRADPRSIEILNAFLKENPEHRYIKWHTHSVETIRTFGNYYAENFSSGDISSYDEQINYDPDFIGMVVTPKKILIYGRDNPKIRTVSSFPSTENKRIKKRIEEHMRQKNFSIRDILEKKS